MLRVAAIRETNLEETKPWLGWIFAGKIITKTELLSISRIDVVIGEMKYLYLISRISP